MAKKRWSDVSPSTRRLIEVCAAFEAVMKVAALVDLARRPAALVHGSKARWATMIVLVNSVGLVPIAYFLRGRRRS